MAVPAVCENGRPACCLFDSLLQNLMTVSIESKNDPKKSSPSSKNSFSGLVVFPGKTISHHHSYSTNINCFCDHQKLLGRTRNLQISKALQKRQSCRARSARLVASFLEALAGA